MNLYNYTVIGTILETLISFTVLCTLQSQYKSIWRIGLTCLILATVNVLLAIHPINFETIINIAAFTVAVWLLYRNTFLDSFFDIVTGLSVVICLELFSDFVIQHVNSHFYDSYLYIIIELIALLLAVLIIAKALDLNTKLEDKYNKNKRECGIVFVMLLIITTLLTQAWNTTQQINMIFFSLGALLFISAICLMYTIFARQKEQKEMNNLLELSRTREQYLRKMSRNQHEFKRHLQAIRSIAKNKYEEEEPLEQIIAYIDNMTENDAAENKQPVYMNNGMISAFLSEKKIEAKEKQIDLTIIDHSEDGKCPLLVADFVVLAGNLIDNAVEATVSIDSEDKNNVLFEMGCEDNTFFIQTINPKPAGFESFKRKITNSGFSTKSETGRGYGLTNVAEIAKAGNGKLTILTNEDVIIVRVTYNVPSN